MPIEKKKSAVQRRMEPISMRDSSKPKVLRSFWVDPDDWENLKAYWKRRGMSISGGVRFALVEFMKKEGILD